MSENELPRPAKRARGSYAKLICYRCRERRIKCQLPDDGSVQPSDLPQPSDKACVRCRQQGMACVVRKTTLGRPSQKPQVLNTPSSTGTGLEEVRSPSPNAEDLVILAVEEGRNDSNGRLSAMHEQPASVEIYGAINRTFDLTSALLARDKRFGSSIAGLKDVTPAPLQHVLDEELVELLDEQ